MAKAQKKVTTSSKGQSTEPGLQFLSKAHPAVRDHLSATTDLPTFLASVGALSLNDRKRLVEQALLLIDDNYVHLPFKEAMHGVDPVQQLRLIKHQLDQATPSTMGSEFEFHRAMLQIFISVRDLHTNYLLPAPFNNMAAFMPFDVEEYYDVNGEPHYIATHFMQGFVHRTFTSGVEIVQWNGVPIKRAIEVIANQNAGSNMAARHVRGLDRLTNRPLLLSLPPDELWVIIGYIDRQGNKREMRQDWLVSPVLPDIGGVDPDATDLNAASIGVDLEAQLMNSIKRMLYAPQTIEEEKKKGKKLSTKMADAGQTLVSTMPTKFKAKSVQTPSGTFGYIRIFSFNVDDPEAFIQEFIRLAELLPQDGLIIDVRGNGGGHIWASEGLLQILTPLEIEPERTQFINTQLNLRICARHEANPVGIDLAPWVESIRDSVRTGAVFSRSFPITPKEFANQWGQRYHGPVVLVTDGRCYSATDIFAAGFKDHEIGLVLGVDDNTGAGGANVWTHDLLRQLLQYPPPPDPESPYAALPNGANMRVSIRRTLRVRQMAGTPVEDIGIKPDKRHYMTKDDLLQGNKDLINTAAKMLKAMPVRKLKVNVAQAGSSLNILAGTQGIGRIDCYIDGRPMECFDIGDGNHSFMVELPAGSALLVMEGFKDTKQVAARRIEL